jgi:hypothetical protein
MTTGGRNCADGSSARASRQRQRRPEEHDWSRWIAAMPPHAC